MATSSMRFVLFLAFIMGTLWTTRGAIMRGSNTAVMLQRGGVAKQQQQQQQQQQQRLSRISSMVPLEIESLWVRGGEISMPDDEEDEGEGVILAKLRNVIRSILQIGDDKAPIVSGFLRTCFKTIESLTGMSLLPPKEKPVKKKGGKSKSKSKKKETGNGNGNGNGNDDNSNNNVDDDDNTTTTTDDDDDSSKEGEKTKKKPAAKKKGASKKASAAAKKHLDTKIRSTNPNYRIQKELKAFLKSPPDNLSVQVGSNIRLWIVTIEGAKGTIYEGETFKLRIEFPKEYPTVPPSVYFLKKFIPLHEHVYTNGDICLSLLGNGWRPTMSAQSIAVSILSILSSAQKKCLPMDNAMHSGAKPGQYQKDWVYHDDNC